jgi:hypothetical protein
MGLDTKTYWLTDWLTVSRNVTLTLTLTWVVPKFLVYLHNQFTLLRCLVNINLRKRVPYACRFYCRAQTDAELSMSVIVVATSRENTHDNKYILYVKRGWEMFECMNPKSFGLLIGKFLNIAFPPLERHTSIANVDRPLTTWYKESIKYVNQ